MDAGRHILPPGRALQSSRTSPVACVASPDLHEFREMLERAFVQLGHATLKPKDSLEAEAEEFAITARMETLTRELPVYFKMVGNIEKNWPRYFGYGFLFVFFVAYMFGCALLPQFEDMMVEARRQRYVRT
jgi:hypothetical protein